MSSGIPAPQAPGTFALAVHEEHERAVVVPRGEVDLATVPRVSSALAGLKAPVRLLDLRAVSFLDTSGLRMVLDQHREAERGGHRFALVQGPPAVQRLFEIAGLTERLEFVDAGDLPGGDGQRA